VCSPCLKERINRDIPTVIVDLRSPGDAKKGHIPGAALVPITELSHSVDKFPKDKRAPMVLYSYDTKSAIQAYEIISIWGNYTNIGVLDGGFDQWVKDGGQVAKGDMPTKIVYEPKPRPGEMGVDEFKKIAETRPANVFILDVRDTDEAETGMLVGAKNIPTQDIKDRVAEIPKDKTIVIHCSTGARADIAHSILTNELGYKNVKFLNANIKIDPNGRYEITKD
jgi:rhodanese-related sulfurtransferase